MKQVTLNEHLVKSVTPILRNTRVTVAMMLDPGKYGLVPCSHCNGYGSSLKESNARCTQCEGIGLVTK